MQAPQTSRRRPQATAYWKQGVTLSQPGISRQRPPLAYGLVYMATSIGLEIALMVLGRLRVPEDNAIIAPIILIVAPIAAGWLCGYRTPKTLAILAGTTVALTLLGVFVVNRLTGISTGLVAPIVIRTAAGALAARLTVAR